MPAAEGAGSPRHVEVKQGDWQPLDEEGVIFTEGLSTCIGISVYDRIKKAAVLGHFDNSPSERRVLEAMIEAIAGFSTPGSRVWLGGGALLDPDLDISRNPDLKVEDVEVANSETQLFRDKVLESVKDLVSRGAALETFWLQGAVYLNYSLDVGTGQEQAVINQD